MEECKDSVTSLDISDHEILVGSADSRWPLIGQSVENLIGCV